ncbi:hypothetical protein QE152_g38715 [Popillia japonica]|uniref:Uncharacterized protein n=1 Tax=Popillia japonica TaxID=7064 RepID=A0AAW1HVQ6_POPJA
METVKQYENFIENALQMRDDSIIREKQLIGQYCSNVSNTADEDSYDNDEKTRKSLLLEESIEIQEEEEGSDEDIIVEVALEDQ